MRKFSKNCLVAMLVALMAALPLVGYSQGIGVQVQPFKAKYVSDVLTAVSTDVGIYIKYVGTSPLAATVAVDAATGDVALVAGGAVDVGLLGTVDPTNLCGGGTANSLDVDDAQCNTIGLLVDMINASPNWVAVPHGMLRTDTAINTLITLGATSAKGPNGLGLLKDTVVTLSMTNVLMQTDQYGQNRGIQSYMSGNRLITNPFMDTNTTLTYASEIITTTNDVGNLLRVLCVIPQFKDNGASTETVVELYREPAALTTVLGAVTEVNDLTCNGGKLLVRTNGNTTFTVPTLLATGYAWVSQ